jgi:hypothetical protein
LGTAFELPLTYLQHWVQPSHIHKLYEMRHLVTHLFFLIAVFCGYVLSLRLFKAQWVACLAFVMLAFQPRLYAHSFFNSKDLPFLSAFLIAMLLFHLAFEKNKTWLYALLGFAVGYAADIRAIGIVLLPCAAMFFLVDLIKGWRQGRNRWLIPLNFVVFAISFLGTFYALWPFLWGRPLYYFSDALHGLSTLYWSGEVLFNGKVYSGMALPYSYLPGWFAITMPEVWLLAGVAGVLLVTARFLKAPIKSLADNHQRHFLMYLACFVLPCAAVMVNHSVVIDDWRHLYFIYPPFVMLALYAVTAVAPGRWRQVVQGLCLAQFGAVAFFMGKNHPFQQVYFNHLVSHKDEYLREHYDMEYWACAFKQGMEGLLARNTDTTHKLVVHNWGMPVVNAYNSLTQAQQDRIEMTTDYKQADYFITNFRNHPEGYPYPVVVYEVKVHNSTIMRVYKMR